jgi:hypothetical protein
MKNFIAPLHVVMSMALLLGYGWLIIRFSRKEGSDKTTGLEKGIAHLVRLFLLLIYLTGLLMTIPLYRKVNPLHHYAALLPVAVLFIFQMVPMLKVRNVYKVYGWMFLLLIICIMIIIAASRLSLTTTLKI